ncbi:MAG: c-type cytochrome [Gammaproteobacteria bacterium]
MHDSTRKRLPLMNVLGLMLLASVTALPIAVQAASSARKEFTEALQLRPDLGHGSELFRACAKCHGVSGNGADDGSVPRIAGQHFRVLVRQLVDYRHETRWDIRMEHYAGRGLLADSQAIADVAAYAAQLARDAPRNVGDGTFVRRGAQVYAERCAECHGASGEGEGLTMNPRLAGQHYAYLLRQIYDAVDGRRPNFSVAHVKILARLDRDDIVGVADFLARSEWTGPKQVVAAK